jgi:two-component system, NarL family, response regulator LiaR
MMVREGLKILLSTQNDLLVIGEAEGGAQALRLCREASPDVVLMDVVMPDMDGATTTAHLLETCPDARVIALTSFIEVELVERALDAGAISYLLKDAQPEKLAQAIRDAAQGRGTVDGSAMQAIRKAKTAETTDWHLTPREQEVLDLLAEGLSNKEIAARLTVSRGTVRLHVSNILAKLGATNRTTAAMMALKHRPTK